MKVLLLNPNQHREPAGPVPPLALDFLAEALVANGHEVKVIDLCFMDDADLVPAIGDFNPAATGITVRNTYDGSMDINFLPRVRDLIATLHQAGVGNIIVGGNGFSTMARRCYEFLNADFAVVGEGEFALLDILDGLARGATTFDTPGIIYRKNGEIVENPRNLGKPTRDINELPRLTRSYIDNARYFRSSGMANIQTKRGCPMECSYCVTPQVQGRRMKIFDPVRVVDEFELLGRQGIKHLYVTDAEFNLPPKAAMAVCEELIRRNNQITWSCDFRPVTNSFTEELIEAMAKAGCREVAMTVDTASPAVAKLNLLAQTRDGVLEATRLFKKYGVYVVHAHVIGLPGQGTDELRELIQLADESKPSFTIFYVKPWVFPGTPLEAYAKNEGRLAQDWNPLDITFYESPHAAELEAMLRREMKVRKNAVKEWSIWEPGNTPPMGAMLSRLIEDKGYYGPLTHLIGQLIEKHMLRYALPGVLKWQIQRAFAKLFKRDARASISAGVSPGAGASGTPTARRLPVLQQSSSSPTSSANVDRDQPPN